MVTRRQHVSMPLPWLLGIQSFRESPIPGLSIRLECARRSTQDLSPIPSSFLTPYPGRIPIPATPLCGGCFHHRWGDPKEGSWRWEPHHLETWNPGGFSKLFQPRGSVSFGCSRCSFTAGGPAGIWRLWASVEGNRLTRPMGQGSLAGTSSPAPSAPRQSLQGIQACPGFGDVAAAQVTKA